MSMQDTAAEKYCAFCAPSGAEPVTVNTVFGEECDECGEEIPFGDEVYHVW